MAKPVIVLADTDENYLSPLEIKFLEELNDKIELEIITDSDYFNEHFSTPQNAEILVVSEDLYTNELNKQSISKIYVLTESLDEGGTEALDVKKIFKYTNTKEIYNQIMATSSITAKSKKEKETTVVLVYSAAGGTGKTTIALGISEALAKGFNKVLYIDAERINTFQYNLVNRAAMPNSVIPEFSNMSGNLFGRINHVIRTEGFDYLPPFNMALASCGLDVSIYTEIIKTAKTTKKYDVIVVDTDSVFDKEKAELITLADKVLIITGQDKNSVAATSILLKNISCNDTTKYHFICNNFQEDKANSISSTEIAHNLMINEYVKHIDDYDSLSVSDIAKQPDIQKVSYLII